MVVVSTLIWDGLEVRLYDGGYVYWRDDGWSDRPGGVGEAVAQIALWGGPLVASGIAVAAVVSALVRRISRRWLRALPYVIGFSVVPFFAFGLLLAVAFHPLLFWADRPD